MDVICANLCSKVSPIRSYAKTAKLLNLGGNKFVSNALDCLANLMKFTSMKLSNRSVLSNSNGKFCSYFLAKMVNSILKLISYQIFGKNMFLGACLRRLKKSMKLLNPICSVLDVIVNYEEMFSKGLTYATVSQIIFECVKTFTKTFISCQIFALLLGTEIQLAIGPIIFALESLCGSDNSYAFLCDGVEEVSELLLI